MDAEKKKALVELFQEILDRDLIYYFNVAVYFNCSTENNQMEALEMAARFSELFDSPIERMKGFSHMEGGFSVRKGLDFINFLYGEKL